MSGLACSNPSLKSASFMAVITLALRYPLPLHRDILNSDITRKQLICSLLWIRVNSFIVQLTPNGDLCKKKIIMIDNQIPVFPWLFEVRSLMFHY